MPDSGVTNQGLQQILNLFGHTFSQSLNRSAAAALTVAFEICKTDYLSKGEKVSDELIKGEIRRILLCPWRN